MLSAFALREQKTHIFKFSSLRCWADRSADCAAREGSHDACHRLKLAIFHDALDPGCVVDIFKRIA
jgi:hypothetical protein